MVSVSILVYDSDMLHQGKRALVTGGSGAIGRAICLKLAEQGCEIVLTYFSDKEGALETQRLVLEHGVSASVLRVNFADEAHSNAFLADLARFEHFDFVIANAASGVFRPLPDLTIRHWQWAMDVNVTSLFRVVQGLLADANPRLSDGGRIIAISSLGAERAIPDYAGVGASKAALQSLVRNLCMELGPRRITANVVSPGLVLTKALDHFANKEQLLEAALRKTPAPRLATPEDVAGVVNFLASDEASMISGQVIHVDGGYVAVA